MNNTQTSVEAIHKSLVVNCNRGRAFEVFTREIGSWWPTDSCHSIGGEKIVDVVFEERVGGRIFERYGDGGECDWGSVLLWEPPERFVMKWHPGRDDSRATELEVRFAAEGERTRVDLEHRGWEVYAAEADEAQQSYDCGWDAVLGHYERKLNG
jgi:uncharacterized protein YndB with AHSA1/START domain